MHINLPDDVKAWIETAESFLKETKPWEVEAEMNNGKVPEEIDAKHRQMAIDLGLSSMDMPKSIGGKELSNLQQVAVWEVLGRSTNALTWCFSDLKNGCLRHAMKNKLKNTFCRSWMEVDMNAMRLRNLNRVQSLMFQPLQKKSTADML